MPGMCIKSNAQELCPICHWSGDVTKIFSQRDENYNFETISARKLRREGRHECVCCSILMGFLDAMGALDNPLAVVRRDKAGCLTYQRDGDGEGAQHYYTMEIFTLNERKSSDGLPQTIEPRPVAFLRHLRDRKGNTSSDDSLLWVERQLSRCETMHQRCRMLQESFLPTRLIKLSPFSLEDQDVALVLRSEITDHPKYLALSHCWGNISIHCLTTRANFDKQRQRIPWGSLTQTFKDAVDFSRRLGIGYIWIDSMCIIQQDTDDWLSESTQMCAVYQNAYATIVGVHASDGNEGLYSEYSRSAIPFPNTLTIGGYDHQLYTKDKSRSFHSWYSQDLPPKSPLFKRAWCFQERIISPRVIYFAEDEIVWECFTEAFAESAEHEPTQEVDNPKLHHIAAFLDQDHDHLRAEIIARTTQTGFIGSTLPTNSVHSNSIPVEEARWQYRIKQWHNVVTYFSELDITNELDRLPALGALAEQYQQLRKSDTYLAGLWKSSCINDLLWFPTAIRPRRVREIYVAPSWSWVSIRSPVEYFILETPYVEVLVAECHYVDDKPFGLAISGMLTLKGSVIPLVLRREASHEGDDDQWGSRYLWQEKYGLRINFFNIDDGYSSIPTDVQNLFALEIGLVEKGSREFSLLLGRVENEDVKGEVYTRLGCLHWDRMKEIRLSHRCPEVVSTRVCRII